MMNLGENLQFAANQKEVDVINEKFYGKIKYPWPPAAFEKITRSDFWTKMISQDIGYWQKNIFPKNMNIWVAGCGTNQAIFTALKFPEARIIGSDLSKESLHICQKNADNLEIKNLELRHESINSVKYSNLFDYIVCTGVIHHNSNPVIALSRLTKALKSNGIIELMVYNKFHRLTTSAFQLAIRLLVEGSTEPNLDKELPIAKMLVKNFKNETSMGNFLKTVDSLPDAAFADALLQPVEHSYTIESLIKIASECNLELLTFCIDQFSCIGTNFTWNLDFEDHNLQNLYDNLSDNKRWQITNLLKGEKSPMLWFYMQKRDSSRQRKTERQICEEFLNTKFKKVDLLKNLYVQKSDNSYSKEPMTVRFPPIRNFLFDEVKKIYCNLDEDIPIRYTLQKQKINQTFNTINKLRSCLATSSFPYLEAYQP